MLVAHPYPNPFHVCSWHRSCRRWCIFGGDLRSNTCDTSELKRAAVRHASVCFILSKTCRSTPAATGAFTGEEYHSLHGREHGREGGESHLQWRERQVGRPEAPAGAVFPKDGLKSIIRRPSSSGNRHAIRTGIGSQPYCFPAEPATVTAPGRCRRTSTGRSAEASPSRPRPAG